MTEYEREKISENKPDEETDIRTFEELTTIEADEITDDYFIETFSFTDTTDHDLTGI